MATPAKKTEIQSKEQPHPELWLEDSVEHLIKELMEARPALTREKVIEILVSLA